MKDKPAEYAVFAASDLDWTLVRPPRLQDGTPTGRLEHDAHRSTRSTKITRDDLAAFIVDVVDQNLYVPRGRPPSPQSAERCQRRGRPIGRYRSST